MRVDLAQFAGLAALAAMSGSGREHKRPRRKYGKPLGPPYPATRQQRRAMERASKAAMLHLSPSKKDN